MASLRESTVSSQLAVPTDKAKRGNYLMRMTTMHHDTTQGMDGLTAAIRFKKIKEEMVKSVTDIYKGKDVYDPQKPELRPFDVARMSYRDIPI